MDKTQSCPSHVCYPLGFSVDSGTDLADWEFKYIGLPKFIEAFEECPVTSLKDLIQFNKDHAKQAMPPRESQQLFHEQGSSDTVVSICLAHTDQADLVKAQERNEPEEEIKLLGERLRAKSRKILDQIYEKESINIIAAPVDSAFCIYSAAAGKQRRLVLETFEKQWC